MPNNQGALPFAIYRVFDLNLATDYTEKKETRFGEEKERDTRTNAHEFEDGYQCSAAPVSSD